MMSPLKNNKKIMVDVLVFVRTKTQAPIAENNEIVIKDPPVMMTDDKTLDEYLMVGLFQISLIFLNNCDQCSGMPIGSVIISKEAFAELISTIKNGNKVIKNKIAVTISNT